jgi:GNAT superfamily N-acetyltransferase
MEKFYDIYDIYSRSFPELLSDYEHFCDLLMLDDKKTSVLTETEGNDISGFAVIRKNAIMLLCVDEIYRKSGVGTKILRRAEELIFTKSERIRLGACDTYLYPGVPKNTDFFTKRGYNSTGEVVDMMLDVDDYIEKADTLDVPLYNGDEIVFRLRGDSLKEIEAAHICGDDIEEGWGSVYAECDTVIIPVDTQTGGFAGGIVVDDDCLYNLSFPDAGGFGCVGVNDIYRKMGIGMRLCKEAIVMLHERKVKQCFIGYTHLEQWYGKLGAKVIARYIIAEKKK